MNIFCYLTQKFRLNYRSIKFLYQRITRGWDDSETWSLDFTICKLVYPRLKRFYEIRGGCPCEMTEVEWDVILKKMVNTFKFLSDEDNYFSIWPPDIVEGFDLYNKYFYHLWW